MKNNETITDFQDLIKYLELAKNAVESNSDKIISELKQWKAEVTIDELKKSLSDLLVKVTAWYTKYQDTNNILDIDLEEYDWVSKETSYILGECALVDDLYAEVINHLVLCIGSKMCDELNKRRNI